ncbi:MAG: 5'-methylthioadenosine/adenosylhomocysteine nucleosidase [Clostridium sp.]|nr:5'-methylthioadenosine/adenosylhomocysteine nucleosidase [Bacteroides sp.]MCM1377673.1 5'-methylthioadenosine/adenosylhomocysteine nucleosidase [Prevotella sp.]MCM1428200.1 5'-methylthioadenosine/adenosylhomocysteine nucleosidase [Clostridium sp.]MCM1475931.1 5'-methylthioadenosine/adenosylhomocysteine nucleosidase [Muribaculaceae bacterium]
MKIAILVAMKKELDLLLPLLGDLKTEKSDIFTHYLGKIGSHDVAVAQCGIGKVNSALSAYILINSFSPDLVVNTGVAGGAGAGVRIGQLLVADYAAYHDVWCGPGTEIGGADGCSVFLPADNKIICLARELLNPTDTVFGLICTGDCFVSTHEEIVKIKKSFPSVMAVDMESASIAQVCYLKGVPFNILRIVSDTPGEGENISQYQDFWTKAPQKTFEAVKTLLETNKLT